MWRAAVLTLAALLTISLAAPTAAEEPRWPDPQPHTAVPSTATVYVNGEPVIELAAADGFPSLKARAFAIEARFMRFAAQGPLSAAYLAVRPSGREAVLLYGGHILATADRETALRNHLSPVALAATWANRITKALGAPRPSLLLLARPWTSYGLASWYGPGFSGMPTADGEIFDPHLFTAASRSLPFDTILAVTDLRTRRSVLVRINDRGPFVAGRVLDLSEAAALALGLSGVDTVAFTVVSSPLAYAARTARG